MKLYKEQYFSVTFASKMDKGLRSFSYFNLL